MCSTKEVCFRVKLLWEESESADMVDSNRKQSFAMSGRFWEESNIDWTMISVSGFCMFTNYSKYKQK